MALKVLGIKPSFVSITIYDVFVGPPGTNRIKRNVVHVLRHHYNHVVFSSPLEKACVSNNCSALDRLTEVGTMQMNMDLAFDRINLDAGVWIVDITEFIKATIE